MSQEFVLSDFSGGMNATLAVDKLDPKECLLADNVRLDETGNILSAGAYTHQNTATYSAAAGTNATYVHSLFWNPSLGGVAGVGQDVFIGAALGSMASALAGKNANNQKMTFGSSYNRVYFDVGGTGYWTDMSNLLTVDWPPPTAIGANVTGPTSPAVVTATGSGIAFTGAANIISTSSVSVSTISFASQGQSQHLRLTMGTNSLSIGTAAVTGIAVTIIAASTNTQPGDFNASLLKNGIPVTPVIGFIGGVFGPAYSTFTAGGSSQLWNNAWSQADINSPNFGIDLYFASGFTFPDVVTAFQAQVLIYQGSGFVAGTGGGGSITGGPYTWKITFVDGQGEESDASGDSNAVSLTSQQGTLTAIPLGDARTTARNIYRTGNNLTSHYLVGTIQDNLGTTYSDNTTDAQALQAGVILAGDIPGDYPNTRFNNALQGAVGAPGGMGRFPTLHYDRIFWINPNKPNQIFWSKPLNGFAYPSINFINVGDGKPVTRLISIFGELIIFKTDSIWRLTGTDESSFQLTQTPSAVGTDWPFTVLAQPDKIQFANRWGFWIFNGYTSQPMTTKLDLLLKQDDRSNVSVFGAQGLHPMDVTDDFSKLNEAVGNSDKYYMAYTQAGSGFNNFAWVFDLRRGNIARRFFTAFPLALALDPVTGYVYMGDTAGFVSLADDWNGATQGGTAANLDFQTGYLDVARGSNKVIWALEFFLNTNGQSITPIVYYDNGTSSETLAAVSTTGLQRVVRPLEATGSRKAQNFSVRLNGTINPINVSGTPQIQVVHIKALYDVRTGRARTGQ